MSAESPDDPVPRDAWLREALRHAPDADAAPPMRVNENILRMGRAAVAPRVERAASAAPQSLSTAPSWADSLAGLWAWLARPPVAAGFAGLMVATVVGVMWWGRTPEEMQPSQEKPVAAAPATPAAQTPTVAKAPPESPKPATASTRMAAADAPARKAAPAPAAVAPKQEAPPAPTVAAVPATAAAQNTAVAETARARESAERRDLAAAKSAVPAAAPLADAAAPSALAGRAAAAAATASTAIETPAFSNLRFEIRRKPQAWTWTRDDGAARPVDEAVEAWIAQTDRTARTLWQTGTTGSDTTTATLRFTRDGVVRAVLRLGPSGMRLTRAGKTESAELSRGQAAALLGSLDALGP